MNISFPHDKPGIYTLNGTVAFPAIVDGHNISCEISEDALKQCFEGQVQADLTKAEYDEVMVTVFESARDRIEAVAAQTLQRHPQRICLLQPDDF